MNHFTIFGTTQNITQVSAPAGTNIVNYTLAVARGGTQPTWDYFVVSTYGKQAEFASSLKDGDMVLVSGYLQDSGIEKADTKWLIATQQTVMQAVRMPFPINIILLMGRLTKDPEVRTTGEGKPVANLRIAVDRISRGGSGENTANYIDIISFEKTAEFAAKYLKKGMKIIITGYIRNNNYTNREGLQVYRDAVYATRIEFAESKSSANSTNQYGASMQAPQYGASAQATQYGAPAHATQYGAPAQATQYGAPAQATQYGAPAHATQYGAPAQATQYGAPAQATQYGAPAQATQYGAPTQATQTALPAPAAPVAQAMQAPPAPAAPVTPVAPMTQAPPAPAAPMTQAPPAPAAPMTQAPPVHQGEGYVPAPAAYMDNNLPFA